MRAQQIACALSLMIGTMLPGARALAQGVEQDQQATYTNGQAVPYTARPVQTAISLI